MMKLLKMPGHVPGMEDLRTVLTILGKEGLAALTGGCLRDAYHNMPHKDIDIALYGNVSEATRKRLFTELIARGYQCTCERGDGVNVEPSDADSDRIDHVMQFQTPTGERLDILCYTEEYCSIKQVLESHDHTISQFTAMMDMANQELFVYYLHEVGMGRCYQVRDNVCDKRIAHIEQTCKRLGWSYITKNKPARSTDWFMTERLHELGVA
jgi:hypothetical protein